jgi:hypothetical protein
LKELKSQKLRSICKLLLSVPFAFAITSAKAQVVGTPTAQSVASPAPTPVPSAAPTSAPTATMSPTSAPEVQKSPEGFSWIREPSFKLGQKNLVRTLVAPPAAIEAIESEREEQFMLFPYQSKALFVGGLFYQKRLNSELRFTLHRLSADKAVQDEVLRNMPQVFGAFVYCPTSQEFVFQAPPMDASGKFLVNSKPSRVYLFSLQTGKTELIWRRARDQFGTLLPKMSATPDCVHILLNQALETKGAKTPYGEIVYLKRPTAQSSSKVTVAQEWTFSTLQATPPSGVWKGFSEALFLVPKDPRGYQTSQIPPKVFSISEYLEKKTKSPQVNLFTPSSSRKIVIAGAVTWQKERFEGPNWASDLINPVLDDEGKNVFLLANNFARGGGADAKSQIISYDSMRFEKAEKVHFEGDSIALMSFDIRPKGEGLAISYQGLFKAEEIEKLSDKKIAGVGIVMWLNNRFQWRELVKLFPFGGLEDQHQPNPMFSFDANELFFVEPSIGELAEPKLFQIESVLKRSKEIQFGGKLKKWYWNDVKL